jgi:hypothetical protein
MQFGLKLLALVMLIPAASPRSAAGAAEEKQSGGKEGAAESRASNPALEESIRKLKMPGVRINLQERCVDIEGSICLDKGMLELVACTKGSKEHESIVAVEARPMHIHTALLLLGAEAGNPAIRRPPNGEDKRWIDIPPKGSAVDVLLVFPDKAGKPVEHPVREVITRATPEAGTVGDTSAAKGMDRKFPTHTFLFAGSQLVGDGPGPRKYLSDESGNMISVVTFGDELLCLPGVHSDHNESLAWQINAAGLPAKGTKVILRLRPQPQPAVKAKDVPPNLETPGTMCTSGQCLRGVTPPVE